jgi:hypothetical protein
MRALLNVQKFTLISIALALCGATSSAWATPAQVLIIRHGEKPAQGNDLSAKGEERAKALVSFFKTNPEVTQYGTPVAIYAMAPDDSEDPSRRPIETITPLAESLGLKILTPFARDEVEDLANEILSNPQYDGKMVLICWEHKKIDKLTHKLGVDPEPDEWPDDVFNQVWEIDYSQGQVAHFRQYSQHVLPGDH